MRPWVPGLVLALTCGCGTAAAPPADAGLTDMGPPAACAIRLVPAGAVLLHPSEQVALRALVTPALPRTEVRFGLVGSALDGSLADTRAVTDVTGAAGIGLIAPSSPASFRVRASVRCGADAYLDVSVGDQGFGVLSVTAAYRGARQPSGLGVGIFRAADCDSIARLTPDRVAALPPGGGMVQFSGLPAGLDFVVRGAATGAAGVELATACTGPLRIEANATASASLVFTDALLRVAGAYDVALEFDLSAVAGRAAPVWSSPVAAETARTGGDALLIGSEVASAVADAAAPGQRDAVRSAFEQALNDHLAAEVSAQLGRRDAQITAAFDRFGQAVAGIVANARAAAVFTPAEAGAGADGGVDGGASGDAGGDSAAWPDAGVTPGSVAQGPVDQVQYTLDPGTPDIHRDDVSVVLDGTGRAMLSAGLGDGVDVAFEAFPLPFARLAVAASGALTGRLGVTSAGEFVALSVCPVVVPVLRPATGACDERCIDAACHRAVARVGGLFDTALTATDGGYTGVDLRFTGTAHAPAGVLTIDQLTGPAAGAFRDDPAATVSAVASLLGRGSP